MNNARFVATCLTDLLLGDDGRRETAAGRLAEKSLWREAVGLAAAWRVIPQLRRRLGSCDSPIDGETGEWLRQFSAAAAAQSAFVSRAGARALAELGLAGIEAVAFKGLGLIGNLYRGPAERMLQDCDLLVAEQSLPKTCAVLRDLGFSPLISVGLDDWLRHIEDRVYRTHGYLELVNDESVEIDLHWRLGTEGSGYLGSEEIFRRAEVVSLCGIEAPAAAPLDAMVLTAHHAVRSALDPATTLKDLCDLRRWWEVQPGRWEVRKAVEHFRLCGLSKGMLALWSILAELSSDTAIAGGVGELAGSLGRDERIVAGHCAKLFRVQLEEGPVSKPLLALGVATPSAVWRYLSWRLRTLFRRPFRPLRQRARGRRVSLIARVGRLLRECLRLDRQRLIAIRAVARERRLFESSYRAGEPLDRDRGP